jgi:hypothetical protein
VSAKIHAREFGKLAPYLRYKGCQPRERLVAVTGEPRLFNQNVGGRQIERLCTAAEACPVLVSESPFQRDEGPVNGGGNYDPLKVPFASLNKNRPFAGNSEDPRVPSAVTISRCGQSAGKADLGRGRNPQRLYADHRMPAVKIQSDPPGDGRRSREIVARLIPLRIRSRKQQM